jgi:hypothetical protein
VLKAYNITPPASLPGTCSIFISFPPVIVP